MIKLQGTQGELEIDFVDSILLKQELEVILSNTVRLERLEPATISMLHKVRDYINGCIQDYKDDRT